MVKGWRQLQLGDAIEIASGQVDPKDERIKSLISVGPDNLLSGGGIDHDGLRTAGELGQISGKYAFDRNAILYSKIRPNLNKVGMPTFDGICSADVYPIWVNSASADKAYIFYTLTSERFVADATARSFRTGLPKINRPDLESIAISLPPMDEQRRIASLLSTWDMTIEKLNALSVAKTRCLKALARQLFDPCHPSHQRPTGAWRQFELGDVFTERNERGSNGETLLSITMSEGVIDREEVGRKDTSTEDKSLYKLIVPGDIGYNTMRMWQGVSGLSSLRGIVSPAYTVVTPDNKNISARYAAHLFKSRRMVFDFQRYSQGMTSDTWGLKFPAFSEIAVFLPPLDLQKKQAAVLDSMKAEIDAIDRQRQAVERQKRGLMQKLLTGEWRVGVER